jgi:hypothetical protein
MSILPAVQIRFLSLATVQARETLPASWRDKNTTLKTEWIKEFI